jgi:hypothetical protein
MTVAVCAQNLSCHHSKTDYFLSLIYLKSLYYFILICLLAIYSCNMSKFYAHKRINHGEVEQVYVGQEKPGEVKEIPGYALPAEINTVVTDSPVVHFAACVIAHDSTGKRCANIPIAEKYPTTKFAQQHPVKPVLGITYHSGLSGSDIIMIGLVCLLFLSIFAGLLTFLVSLIWLSGAAALKLGFIVFLCAIPGIILITVLFLYFGRFKG